MLIARIVVLASVLPLAVAAAERVCQTPAGWCPLSEDKPGQPQCFCEAAGETVEGLSVEVARTNPFAALDPAPGNPSRSAIASRSFAGPSEFPPQAFRAYGMMVFKTRPLRLNRGRYMMMCEAYASALAHVREIETPRSEQMVTVWPLSNDKISDLINRLPDAQACELAVDNYGLVQAQNALRLLEDYAGEEGAYDTSGLGPFLIAWTPGDAIAEPDSIALVVDLSHVSSS